MASESSSCFISRARSLKSKFDDLIVNSTTLSKKGTRALFDDLMSIIEEQTLALDQMKDKLIAKSESQLEQQINSNKVIC